MIVQNKREILKMHFQNVFTREIKSYITLIRIYIEM